MQQTEGQVQLQIYWKQFTKPIAQPILSLSIYLDLLILVSALVERGPLELLVPLPPRARDQDARALVLPPGVLRPVRILGTAKVSAVW